jgi:hypothetical protein
MFGTTVSAAAARRAASLRACPQTARSSPWRSQRSSPARSVAVPMGPSHSRTSGWRATTVIRVAAAPNVARAASAPANASLRARQREAPDVRPVPFARSGGQARPSTSACARATPTSIAERRRATRGCRATIRTSIRARMSTTSRSATCPTRSARRIPAREQRVQRFDQAVKNFALRAMSSRCSVGTSSSR